MLELLRINASTHVIDIENVSAGKDFIIYTLVINIEYLLNRKSNGNA